MIIPNWGFSYLLNTVYTIRIFDLFSLPNQRFAKVCKGNKGGLCYHEYVLYICIYPTYATPPVVQKQLGTPVLYSILVFCSEWKFLKFYEGFSINSSIIILRYFRSG